MCFSRCGSVESEQERSENFYVIKGFLPASKSNGFTAELRSKTMGQVFAQLAFDHWEVRKALKRDFFVVGAGFA